MSKRFCQLLIASLLSLVIVTGIAYAEGIVPYADTEFDSASTTLKSSKQVTFRAVTYDTKDCLSVTSCYLEIKNDDGSWSYVCSLPAPTTKYYDAYAYSATVDYSSYIGSGTYRVWATYDADGHSITRCSNERTY